jgi:TPR repeat protein
MKRSFLGLGILSILSGCASSPLENPTAQSCEGYYKSGETQTAEAVCRKISDWGNSEGYYYLSKIELDKGNELESFNLLYKARSNYSSEYEEAEQKYLGRAYVEKVNRNYKEAKEIFELLVTHNNVIAQHELGNIYYFGLGISADENAAVPWYKKASDAGDQNSKKLLNSIFIDDYKKGLKLYKSKKFTEALQVWLPIAKNGHHDALGYIGDIYRLGKLGKIDYSEAAKWYKLAADQDGAYEAYRLALLIKDGKGVPKNTRKAYKYFKKSADKRFSAAYFYVAYFLSEGEGVGKDLTAARNWYEKALAENPSSSIQNNLALMYQYGKGGDRDLNKALKLFKLSAESGLENASINLKTLENMLVIQKKYPKSPELFGINLYGATRYDLRAAIKGSGGKPEREDYAYFADKYNSRSVMPGSSEMLVFYSHNSDGNKHGSSGDYLAKIKYEFPSSNKWYVNELKDALAQKYGNPKSSYGAANLGSVTHFWYKDGVTIILRRGWPNLNVSLSYKVPDFNSKMESEIKASEKSIKLKKYENSTSAF